MGGIIGSGTKRYIGGKFPEKYFHDDVWPLLEELLENLHIDEGKGTQMFKAFCRMDSDESATVDLMECFSFFGGRRTKFNQRIYYHQNTDFGPQGLEFKDFAITSWNYCTLSTAGLARYIFEIFDVAQLLIIERPDVETMYKMLYDCDEHDEYYVRQYPFDVEGHLTKSDFIDHSCHQHHLIQPAIDYQKRLRNKLGGFIMWELLAAYRKRRFQVHDSQSATLEIALVTILQSEDPNRRKRKAAAEKLLEEQKRKIHMEEEMHEKELKDRENFLAEEKRKAEMNAPDRAMKAAWQALEDRKMQFDESEYTIDDICQRADDRQEIFALLDKAITASKEYWLSEDDREMQLTIGSPEDHAARYRDFKLTEEGANLYRRTMLLHLFEAMKQQQEIKKAAVKKKPKTEPPKTEKELAIDTAIINITAYNEAMNLPIRNETDEEEEDEEVPGALRRPTKIKHFDEEMTMAKKYATKAEFAAADAMAEAEISLANKEKLIAQAAVAIGVAGDLRRKDYVRKDFEVCSNYGSRETRWEYLRDKANDRYVYMNIDTLKIIHCKTAICERCDELFEQSEMKCKNCGVPRSKNNFKLYRPLGFKDIRID